MEKRKLVLTIIGVVILAMVIMVYIYFSKPGRDEKKNQQTINQVQTVQQKTDEKKENTEKNTSGDELENVTPGSEEYQGFLLDNVLHSPNEGDIHYNVYIPDAYDGTKEYALYVTLPGYQGLYFQGVGENIRTEDFGFEAQKYITDMIIVAPQLNDWGQTSADQTIELTQYFLTHYIINPSKVYINGYSGGGETLSLVLAKQPELYTAALMCSSQWDGAYEPVVEMKTPVYFVIGESDEYYGSEPFKEAYQQIHELYKEQGLPESEIDKLVVLDVKDKDKTMRINFGAKPFLYPQPVMILGTYDENGKANAMNAAWGGIVGANEIIVDLSAHKTTDNIIKNKAFTVGVADLEHLVACDYVGIVSANKEADKMKKAGFTTTKGEFVNAPIINELPLTLECELVKVIDGSKYLAEIKNVSADEKYLGDDGEIDLSKFTPITYDPVHHGYYRLGERVGNAFKDGAKLK